MTLPSFDESTRAEVLSYEVFSWLSQTAMYARSTESSAAEIYDTLKLVLRLLAVRNPQDQSNAIRRALGVLIQSISEQPGSEQPCQELLGLLIRMVDAKQEHKFNPMKHLALSGLGYFMASNKYRMRQMSVNVFVICIDTVKVCPLTVETLEYRNTILWTMQQCILPTLDEGSVKAAVKFARSMIDGADRNTELGQNTLLNAFNLLKGLFTIPSSKPFEKKMDRWLSLFLNVGAITSSEDVQHAAACYYSVALQEFTSNDFRRNVTDVVNLVIKTVSHKLYGKDLLYSYRLKSLVKLLGYIIQTQRKVLDFESRLDQWLASLLLQLEPEIIESLFVNDIIKRKLVGDFRNMDIVSVLLRQMALSRAPAPTKSSSKSKNSVPRPRLESVLACLTDAIDLLGHSIQPIAFSIHQACLGLLLNNKHPLIDIQLVSVVRCLVTIVRAAPTLLVTTFGLCLKHMEIPTSDPRLHCEIAYVLGSMIALTRPLALYGDGELTKRAMLLASRKIQEVEDFYSYSIGWNLFYGILCLGHQEVKPFVSQLMLMLRSHFAAQSPEVLEKALGGLLLFLCHNESLLTLDVANRLGDMLNSLWARYEHASASIVIRRRLLQCYERLLLNGKLESYPSSLLMRYVAHVTSPKAYVKDIGVHLESAMVLSKAKDKESESVASQNIEFLNTIWASDNAVESGLSSLYDEKDSARSCGNDVDIAIFCQILNNDGEVRPWPTDVYTSVVDLSISVCSNILPLQPERIQESVFDAILSNLENSASLNSLRKSAVMLNTAQLVNHILQNDLQVDDRILKIAVSTLKILLASPYSQARALAAKTCGLLSRKIRSSTVGLQILPALAKELLEFAVDPRGSLNLREGSIKALGYISNAWSQESLVDAHFGILGPLSQDPRPQIHLATIESMRLALLSPDLVDQRFVKQTLKTLVTTYLLETHANSKLFSQQVADTLIQVVSRFGPLLSNEKQENNRKRILCLADQLQLADHSSIRVLAWNSLIELYFYARQGIPWQIFIRRWRDVIIDPNSADEEVDTAVNGLLMLVQLSARLIFSGAGSSLEDALWLLLDRRPKHKILRKLINSWMSQTLDDNASIHSWIMRISAVVMKPRYFFESRLSKFIGKNHSKEPLYSSNEAAASVDPTAVAADEDVSLGVTSDDTSNEQFSWQARQYALDLFIQILISDLNGKSPEQKAVSVTTKQVGDLIKIAFTSATSQISELQYTGLTFLNEIIVQLGDLSDPDFANISLLEQYQVQIVSALSPAFGSDSSPGLALIALQTVATFLGSNIIKTKEKLGRLLKILDESLSSMSDLEKFKLGKLEMSVDAAKALRVAVLAVWAEIEINAKEKSHLQEIIDPRLEKLTELWADSISTYGRLQSEVDAQWSQSSIDDVIDQIADTQFRSLMKPIFKTSWLKFIRAIATLELVSHPAEHTDLLVILCGLCFQEVSKTLSTTSLAQSVAESMEEQEDKVILPTLGRDESLTAYRLSVLQTLASILTPEVSRVLFDLSIDYIEENVPLLYRVMLVGQPEEQICVLTIARNLVAGQPDTDDNVDHFFEILKISVLPLRHLFPQLIDSQAQQRSISLNGSQTQLLRQTMNTVIDIAQVFRDVIKTDLWVSLLKAFEELNHREPAVAAPSFKRFLEVLATQVELRGVVFVVDALTMSLKRAVETPSLMEGLFISTAIVCTNAHSLTGSSALHYVYQFGLRAATVLEKYLESPETGESDASVVLQLVIAVLRASSTLETGVAFAYGCLPVLCQLTALSAAPELRQRAASALTICAALNGSAETLAVVVPSILTLAESGMQNVARSLLLQIVTKQPGTFKQVVWEMNSEDRAICQGLLAQPTTHESETEDNGSENESEGEITLTSFA